MVVCVEIPERLRREMEEYAPYEPLSVEGEYQDGLPPVDETKPPEPERKKYVRPKPKPQKITLGKKLN